MPVISDGPSVGSVLPIIVSKHLSFWHYVKFWPRLKIKAINDSKRSFLKLQIWNNNVLFLANIFTFHAFFNVFVLQIEDIFGPENGYATKTLEIPVPDQVKGPDCMRNCMWTSIQSEAYPIHFIRYPWNLNPINYVEYEVFL